MWPMELSVLRVDNKLVPQLHEVIEEKAILGPKS